MRYILTLKLLEKDNIKLASLYVERFAALSSTEAPPCFVENGTGVMESMQDNRSANGKPRNTQYAGGVRGYQALELRNWIRYWHSRTPPFRQLRIN